MSELKDVAADASYQASEVSCKEQLNGSKNGTLNNFIIYLPLKNKAAAPFFIVIRKDVATSCCSTNSSETTLEKSKMKEATKEAKTPETAEDASSFFEGMKTRFRKKFHPKTKF